MAAFVKLVETACPACGEVIGIPMQAGEIRKEGRPTVDVTVDMAALRSHIAAHDIDDGVSAA